MRWVAAGGSFVLVSQQSAAPAVAQMTQAMASLGAVGGSIANAPVAVLAQTPTLLAASHRTMT